MIEQERVECAPTNGTGDIEPIEASTPLTRPRTRGDCRDGVRPCPWSCKYNLLYEADARGGVSLSRSTGRVTIGRSASDTEFNDAADGAIEEWAADPPMASCCLDVVEENPDGMSLESVADVLRLTRERVRQIQSELKAKLAKGAESLNELEVANGC